MVRNTAEILAGALVLLVAAGFLIYSSRFADVSAIASDQYALSASFRSAEGVQVGTDIRLAGVKVGTVTALELDPETFRAETRFAIDGGIALPEDTAAVVSSEGLLGGNFVELLPGGSPFNLEPGAEIQDTQGAVSLIQLLVRFVAGSEE